MWAAKGLAALAILVAGAVAAFTVYTLARHDGDGHAPSDGRWVRTVSAAGVTHRIYTLRDGDVVLRPQAATQCEASGEAGIPNLFCQRIGGGRHQVIFYRDDVLIWPLARGPDGPPFSYRWQPLLVRRLSWAQASSLLRRCRVRRAEQTHDRRVKLTLRDGRSRLTREPQIDDVVELLDSTRDRCGPVVFATE